MTRLSNTLLCTTALVLPLLAGNAAAQSLRCKNDLASVGETKASVAAKCGQPVATDSYCKPQSNIVVPGTAPQVGNNHAACYNVDVWTYRPGSGQLMTTLKFESGRLKSIEYGDRVP